MSVLVDVTEIRALVRGPDHGGYTGLQIKDKLSTTAKVAAALIRHGHLATITAINPVNRCPIAVVPAAEVEHFAAEYVSLFALAALPDSKAGTGGNRRRVRLRSPERGLDMAMLSATSCCNWPCL